MRRDAVRAALVFVILGAVGVRALAEVGPLPGWDSDPLAQVLPETRVTPTISLALDTAQWLALLAALWLWTRERAGGRWAVWGLVGLAGIGAAWAAAHGLILPPYGAADGSELRGNIESLHLGGAWAGAWAAGLACAVLAQRECVRRVLAAGLLALAIPLAVDGLHQYTVEHDAQVLYFEENRAAVLANQGLEPGSSGARVYERRLVQREAVGAFGLANVYGSVLGACAAGWVVAIAAGAGIAGGSSRGGVGGEGGGGGGRGRRSSPPGRRRRSPARRCGSRTRAGRSSRRGSASGSSRRRCSRDGSSGGDAVHWARRSALSL